MQFIPHTGPFHRTMICISFADWNVERQFETCLAEDFASYITAGTDLAHLVGIFRKLWHKQLLLVPNPASLAHMTGKILGRDLEAEVHIAACCISK